MKVTVGHSFLRALLLALSVLAVLNPSPAPAEEADDQEFAELINAERARSNLPLLSPDSALLEVAEQHSARMAEEGRLFHNLSLGGEVSGWISLGENVGRGPKAELIHQAFMASPTHRDLILEPQFRGFAVASVSARGEIFVTELFVLRGAVEVFGFAPRKPSTAPAVPIPEAIQPIARPAPLTVPTSIELNATPDATKLGLRALALLLLVLDAQILKFRSKLGSTTVKEPHGPLVA